ncbi:hypothetical protein AVEN_218143-1 [Araneus ventricosus]|uniref:Uncharacterized protein n=1 Tax=Araneus ventricosus TaxID=182803 RepID=A0A4Y2KVW2_ARAVE|nr:hypothetical protein AVEN_218143-1 [Araneus ventricosus]
MGLCTIFSRGRYDPSSEMIYRIVLPSKKARNPLLIRRSPYLRCPPEIILDQMDVNGNSYQPKHGKNSFKNIRYYITDITCSACMQADSSAAETMRMSGQATAKQPTQ